MGSLKKSQWQRKCHIKIELWVKWSVLQLCHLCHVVQSRQSCLSLTRHNWFSRRRQRKRDLLLRACAVIRTSKTKISNLLRAYFIKKLHQKVCFIQLIKSFIGDISPLLLSFLTLPIIKLSKVEKILCCKTFNVWIQNRGLVLFQGSLPNTDYLAFNLTSWETSSETQGIGVTTRDVVSTQTK